MQERSADSQEKQTYLRKQVIEQGYSAQDFLDFLLSRKPDGADINSWTFSELKQLVKLYKSHTTETAFNKRLSEIIDDEEVKSGGRETFDELKEPRVEYEKYNLFDKAFKKVVEAVPFKRFLDREHAVPEIVVEKPEVKVTGGFFFGIGRTSSLWYSIRCNVLADTIVKRSDNDIEWLHDTLVKLYPSAAIPPFNKFTGDLDKEDRRSLERRSRLLGYFLTSASQNQLLFNSKLFMAFLSWTDYNKFSQFKTNVSKLPAPTSINHIPSKDGLVELQISSRNRSAVRAGQSYLNHVSPIYQKLDIDLHSVMRDLDTLSTSVGKMGTNFASLQEQYSNMVNYSADTKNDALSNMFLSLNATCNQWSRALKEYRRSMIDHVSLLFRYVREENNSLLDMFRTRNQHEEEYLQYKASLTARKLKIFNQGDNWGIPPEKLSQLPDLTKDNVMTLLLPRQTEQENQRKEWQSFLNKTCEKEFRRFNRMSAHRLATVFGKMAQQMAVSCGKELAAINSLAHMADRKSQKVIK